MALAPAPSSGKAAFTKNCESPMRTAAISFLISLVLAAALTPMVRAFAIARGWFDYGLEARKVHGRPIPRLGGVAIVLAFYAPLLGMLLYPTGMALHFYADAKRASALMLGGLAIAALGLYDDLRGAGAVKKLLVQLGVAGALTPASPAEGGRALFRCSDKHHDILLSEAGAVVSPGTTSLATSTAGAPRAMTAAKGARACWRSAAQGRVDAGPRSLLPLEPPRPGKCLSVASSPPAFRP